MQEISSKHKNSVYVKNVNAFDVKILGPQPKIDLSHDTSCTAFSASFCELHAAQLNF